MYEQMNRDEFDKMMVKEFPLLYSDRYTPMTTTCMCWGFDTSPGWNDILYEASSKLEPLIQKLLDENLDYSCRWCGEWKSRHTLEGKYKTTNFLPYSLNTRYSPISPFWRQGSKYRSVGEYLKQYSISTHFKNLTHYYKWAVKNKINRVLYWTFENLAIGKDVPFECKGYQAAHPRASQVKEKYGYLCLYMTTSTEEMEAIIEEAEQKSQITCEACGLPGVLMSTGGWLKTLCTNCSKSSDYCERNYRPVAELTKEMEDEEAPQG